jgi:F0F1-type ATP synthase epsilon subunit
MSMRQNASTGEIVQDKTDPKDAAATLASSTDTMHVKVYSPFRVYFDQDANSISGENTTGPFDILPRHHNFMALLIPCELVVRTARGIQKIRISRGIMHVKANQVIVFLDV